MDKTFARSGIDDNTQRTLDFARAIQAREWPFLRAEPDVLPSVVTAGENLDAMLDGREITPSVLDVIDESVRDLIHEHSRRLVLAKEERASAYLDACKEVEAVPGWKALPDAVRETVILPLRDVVEVVRQYREFPEDVRAETARCPDLLRAALAELAVVFGNGNIIPLNAEQRAIVEGAGRDEVHVDEWCVLVDRGPGIWHARAAKHTKFGWLFGPLSDESAPTRDAAIRIAVERAKRGFRG
jgi:hypothetical protein